MDFRKLKRDPEYVLGFLPTVGKQRIAKKEMRVVFPSRFTERGLASLGHENYVIGYVAFIVDDRFTTLNVPAMVQFDPALINEIEINGVDYHEFVFNSGDIVIANTDLVQRDTLIYYVLAELFSKGNIPAYIGFYELAAIFDNAERFAGTKVVSDRKVIELWISILARDAKNPTRYYAETIESENDIVTRPPEIVGMRNVSLIASGTLNRFGGSYMYDGIVSSLLNQSNEVGLLEAVYRQ